MHSLWMLLAAFMFSIMGVGVKFAAETYSIVELVMYRSLVGVVLTAGIIFIRGGTFRTPYPMAHFWRAAIGATAFGLWFYAMSKLPIATAMTLNYMSPIWLALILFVANSTGHCNASLNTCAGVLNPSVFLGLVFNLFAISSSWL